MIFTRPSAYECRSCHRWWMPGSTACLVAHQGDGCCHYGETECEAPQPAVTKP
jgi:hypothetical protein